MKYKLRYDATIDACTIAVTGLHRRPDDSHELLRAAADAAKEYGCSRFLFDMREAKIIGGTMATFETANEPERHGFKKHYTVGVVYPAVTEEHRFLENVGVNRGASAFRVFNDMDKAREWIASH